MEKSRVTNSGRSEEVSLDRFGKSEPFLQLRKKNPAVKHRKTEEVKQSEVSGLKALQPTQHVNVMPVQDQGSENQGLAKQMRTNLRDFSRDREQDKDLRSRITHRTTDYH